MEDEDLDERSIFPARFVGVGAATSRNVKSITVAEDDPNDQVFNFFQQNGFKQSIGLRITQE